MNDKLSILLHTIVNLNMKGAMALLYSNNINAQNESDVYFGLVELINEHGEQALQQIVKLHPNYDLISEFSAGGNFSNIAGDTTIPTTQDTSLIQPQNGVPASGSAQVPGSGYVPQNTKEIARDLKNELESLFCVKINIGTILLFALMLYIGLKIFKESKKAA